MEELENEVFFESAILNFFFQEKNFFFEEKNSKWPIFQNGRFSKSPILKIFSQKFHILVLGLEGLIDAKGIDVAQPIWL